MAGFRVGDRLIHPVHGAGTVVAREKLEEEGDTKEYYVIELDTPNGRPGLRQGDTGGDGSGGGTGLAQRPTRRG